MILKRLTEHSCFKDRYFMEQLIESSFPREEYRDMDKMRALIDGEERFHACLILSEKEEPVGVANYWDFSSFIYLEHLVIKETLRNQGMGAKALESLKAAHPVCPVVLEAELPDGKIQRRRIGFYKRCGFRILDGKYFQPAYRKDDHPFEMVLLMNGDGAREDGKSPSQDLVREMLYKEAYQLNQEEIEALI